MLAGVSVSLHRKSPNPERAQGQPETQRKDDAFYLLRHLATEEERLCQIFLQSRNENRSWSTMGLDPEEQREDSQT